MLLLAVSRRQQILDSVLAATEHVELASDPRFQDAFVDSMSFPASLSRESPESSGRRASSPCPGSISQSNARRCWTDRAA